MLPLHWAAKCENLVMAKMLIANGTDVNISDNYQRTPLYQAVEEEREAGAEVGAELKTGDTALHRASQLGHTRIAQTLLDRGADVNGKGKEGKTALHFACEGGYAETVGILLRKNVGVIHVSEYDDNSRTPLHVAVDGGHPDIAKLLSTAPKSTLATRRKLLRSSRRRGAGSRASRQFSWRRAQISRP